MTEESPTRIRRRWPIRLATAVGLVVGGLLLLLAALVAFLDTGPGHRFLVDRIAALSPSSGLKVRIGRIEGSIWSDARLRDVRLYDPEGLFAESPLIDLDWRPAAWLANRLSIDSVTSDLVILHRLPRLRPSERPGPILPDFDIWIGRLEVEQFRLGEAITGTRRSARISGSADIRSGRAVVRLDGAVRGSGERLRLALDAEPDRETFDLEAYLNAPEDSVVGALIGTRRPMVLQIGGDGSWAAWDGSARCACRGGQPRTSGSECARGAIACRGGSRPLPSSGANGRG